MKNNRNSSYKGTEKKLWMRIAVLAICAVMFLGFVLLPIFS